MATTTRSSSTPIDPAIMDPVLSPAALNLLSNLDSPVIRPSKGWYTILSPALSSDLARSSLTGRRGPVIYRIPKYVVSAETLEFVGFERDIALRLWKQYTFRLKDLRQSLAAQAKAEAEASSCTAEGNSRPNTDEVFGIDIAAKAAQDARDAQERNLLWEIVSTYIHSFPAAASTKSWWQLNGWDHWRDVCAEIGLTRDFMDDVLAPTTNNDFRERGPREWDWSRRRWTELESRPESLAAWVVEIMHGQEHILKVLDSKNCCGWWEFYSTYLYLEYEQLESLKEHGEVVFGKVKKPVQRPEVKKGKKSGRNNVKEEDVLLYKPRQKRFDLTKEGCRKGSYRFISDRG